MPRLPRERYPERVPEHPTNSTIGFSADHRCAGTGKVRRYGDRLCGDEQARMHPLEAAKIRADKEALLRADLDRQSPNSTSRQRPRDDQGQQQSAILHEASTLAAATNGTKWFILVDRLSAQSNPTWCSTSKRYHGRGPTVQSTRSSCPTCSNTWAKSRQSFRDYARALPDYEAGSENPHHCAAPAQRQLSRRARTRSVRSYRRRCTCSRGRSAWRRRALSNRALCA